MKARKKPKSTWKWAEGIVNTDNDHIKIRYGKELKAVALVAPSERNSLTVQFPLKARRSDKKTQKIIKEVHKELDFYLVEKNEDDPWTYAIYHCGTASNLYSKVHWSYYPNGHKD